MQSSFNKNKRKHEPDAGGLDVSRAKHIKQDGNLPSKSSSRGRSPCESRSKTGESGPTFGGSKSLKLAGLLSALDDALLEDGLDELLSLVGDETFQRCLDLRTSLRKDKSIIDAAAVKPQSLSPVRSHDHTNSLRSFPIITPWKASNIPTSLPPLPEVLDPTLEAGAFIHQGYGARSGAFSDLTYERLEWIGDAYLYLITTLLISQTFPSLLPGKCSHLRERCVKNIQLAEYSRQYGFDKRAKLPDEHLGTAKVSSKEYERVKILGDIFEAYIAAVVLSDPTNGVSRVSEWLKALLGMTLAKEIIQEERDGVKFDSPLWRLRGTDEPVKLVGSEPPPLNPKEKLQRLIGARGIRITYKDAAPERKDKNRLAVFTVGAYLDGWGEKDKLLGIGKANGKKEAGWKAAEVALGNTKLMKAYIEKKRVFDAQMELERQVLETSNTGS